MQTFISETLDDILKTQVSFEDCVFVLPSQRAGVFVKNTFKTKISTGFLPEIYNIEQFISQISELRNIDTIQLLFHFYKIYSEVEQNPDSFEDFASWAFVALQDFNEVDQYLINSEDLFNYLRDIQRMKKWSVRGEFKETDLIKDHFFFMERLGKYYAHLYQFLVAEKVGYQGLMYREASKKVSSFLNKHPQKKFFFIGFNALNKAEEFLFQEFLTRGNTSVYWDIDIALYKTNHSAGSFIRKYATEWAYYEKKPLKLIGDNFAKKKNIEVIGTAKNISQLKYAGEILETLEDHENTALVLGDESLLSVALNSIPRKVKSINITMGYPLQDVPASHFITSVFQLFITQDKLQKTGTNEFYYKDVIRFFKNPIVSQLINKYDPQFGFKIHDEISKENRSFINLETLKSYLKPIEEIAPTFITIFKPLQSVDDFIGRILYFIEEVRENMSVLEKEYIFR
ncbi:MAG: PD-(D/E)XK nuclease family protein, partial [Flavobacteriaceae bacterium]|nr:PD-(D/E)XK nuclease family protein [Flavobacteriaceae bacterium]